MDENNRTAPPGQNQNPFPAGSTPERFPNPIVTKPMTNAKPSHLVSSHQDVLDKRVLLASTAAEAGVAFRFLCLDIPYNTPISQVV